MFRLSAFALLSASLVASLTPYIGCFSDVPPANFGFDCPVGANQDQCAEYCGSLPNYGAQASYVFSDNDPTLPGCYVSSDPPSQAKLVAGGSGTSPSCTSRYKGYKLRTSFDFKGCYDPLVSSSQSEASVGDCFAYCAPSNYAWVFAIQPDMNNRVDCLCSSVGPQDVGMSPMFCSSGAMYAYQRDTAAVESHLARRAARLGRKTQQHELCPSGLTACRVDGAMDAFECLDTDNELESCGGCVHGRADRVTSPRGINCESQAGAIMGAMTCSSGHCVASACEAGFMLKGGRCVEAN